MESARGQLVENLLGTDSCQPVAPGYMSSSPARHCPLVYLPIPAMQGLVLETGAFQAPSHLAGKGLYGESQASSPEERTPPTHVQDFFSDPTQWWDNTRSKPTSRPSDLKNKKHKIALWLKHGHKPTWVDSQVARWVAEMKMPPDDAVPTSVRGEVEGGSKPCQDGRTADAVEALNNLVQRGCNVPNNLFYRLLKRCIANKDLVLGRRIHALTIKSGYEGDAFLATHLIGLYASNGSLGEAVRAFSKVSTPTAYNWATIISAYARHGEAAQAIRLYRQMLESTVTPDKRIYSTLLKVCATAGDLVTGKEVHAHILASPGKPDIILTNGLLDMYAKCRSLEDARKLFDAAPQKDVVTWTAMIAGYAQQGMGQEALDLYSSMQQDGLLPPNAVTFICLLQACANVGAEALHQGEQLHTQIIERKLQDDVVLGGSLVNMYAKCGSLEDARRVFDRLPDRNIVTWTAMLAGYTQQGMGKEALSLYNSMHKEGLSPNSVTFVCLLQACASVGGGALPEGKQLHAKIEGRGLQDDVVLGGSLVNMYAKCGSLEDARKVFDRLPHRNTVTWNAMFTGYAQQGLAEEALSLYRNMQQEDRSTPNYVTFVCLLQACANVGGGALHEGKMLHAQIEERGLQDDVVLGGSLVIMYTKCGSLEDARCMFDRLPDRNVVAWTAMIAGYSQQGMGQEALDIYSSMQQEGLCPPDSFTYVCLLQACATLACLSVGKQLHAQLEELGMQAGVVVGTALVNMYAKCGSMFNAQQVFDSLIERNVEAWGALIGGYTRQGDSESVFSLLDRMRLEDLQPDGILFLSVLAVCSHVGLVDKGRKFFEVMRRDYGINPNVEHYTCMIDLLGRAGHLKEALQMAKTIPFPTSSAVWRTLLGACQKWNNIEIGQQAFELAVGADAMDEASYVLMSNIYASNQLGEAAKEMQRRRVKSGAWKQPGQSWWTDRNGVVYTFVVGDKKHLERQGIYARQSS